MKNKIRILGAMLLAALILVSCSSSIESDAKKVAELQCQATELMQKAMSGDTSVMKESQKLADKAAELTQEMQRKYTSESDRKKFTEALAEEIGKCGN